MKIQPLSAIFLLIASLPFNASCSDRETVNTATATANITGRVMGSEGVPLPGVVVSDGVDVTITDANGHYSLSSDKSTGIIFVSTPGDRTVSLKGSRPQFFELMTQSAGIDESHDFTLLPADNRRHALIVHTDHHLARRTSDLSQLRQGFIPDVNHLVDSLRSQGVAVYSVSAGDMSWDVFWYERKHDALASAIALDDLRCPVYHTMGNHDNDPWIAADWEASQLFRTAVAPSYYSFNLGDTHYIVLDDVIYNNLGASNGVVGDRSYDKTLTPVQLRWLERDLATITDHRRPIVIISHVPFYRTPLINPDGSQYASANLPCTADVERLLKPFASVTFLSGHRHRNSLITSTTLPTAREYNIASVCGTMWWTGAPGYAGNNICTDGTPGGYGLMEWDGDQYRYTYKSIGMPMDYQFRVYDLNTAVITPSMVTDTTMRDKLPDYTGGYDKPRENALLVNVFAYGDGWKIRADEEGTPLTSKRVVANDPLHIISYEIPRLNHGAIPTDLGVYTTSPTHHTFLLQAARPTSTITITVTDPHGRHFTRTIHRPLPFTPSLL